MRKQKEITDLALRRAAEALGYKGKHVPLQIAEVLEHPSRPGDSTLLRNDGETRREAKERLRRWAGA